MTPEGKVKDRLKKLLKGYDRLYSHWPVMNGMGAPELDCNIIYNGYAVSIECKAPGESFTPRQKLTAAAKQAAAKKKKSENPVAHAAETSLASDGASDPVPEKEPVQD